MTPEAAPETKEKLMLAMYIAEDGKLRVEGPAMQDKILAYGILGTARDLIHEMHMKAQQSRLVKPNGGQMFNWLRGEK